MIPSTQVPAGRVSEACRAVLRTVGSPCEEMDRARSVLLLAADLVGADGGVDPTTPSDVTEFDAALNVVADLVARRLLAAPYDADAPRLLALSQQVSQARVNLRQAQLVQRSEAIAPTSSPATVRAGRGARSVPGSAAGLQPASRSRGCGTGCR